MGGRGSPVGTQVNKFRFVYRDSPANTNSASIVVTILNMLIQACSAWRPLSLLAAPENQSHVWTIAPQSITVGEGKPFVFLGVVLCEASVGPWMPLWYKILTSKLMMFSASALLYPGPVRNDRSVGCGLTSSSVDGKYFR